METMSAFFASCERISFRTLNSPIIQIVCKTSHITLKKLQSTAELDAFVEHLGSTSVQFSHPFALLPIARLLPSLLLFAIGFVIVSA